VDPHWFQCGQGAKPMRIQKLFLVAVNKVYLLINVNLHVLDPGQPSRCGSGSTTKSTSTQDRIVGPESDLPDQEYIPSRSRVFTISNQNTKRSNKRTFHPDFLH
jgi:hypothetical protein